jgi:hypothetical protein
MLEKYNLYRIDLRIDGSKIIGRLIWRTARSRSDYHRALAIFMAQSRRVPLPRLPRKLFQQNRTIIVDLVSNIPHCGHANFVWTGVKKDGSTLINFTDPGSQHRSHCRNGLLWRAIVVAVLGNWGSRRSHIVTRWYYSLSRQ